MSIWGYYNFDNDTAADFAGSFRDHPTKTLLSETLTSAAAAQPVAAEEARKALAAAEIVAAIQGKPSQDFPADLILVIAKQNAEHGHELRQLAISAVQQVLQHSELPQMLTDQDDHRRWNKLQQELLHRLHH